MDGRISLDKFDVIKSEFPQKNLIPIYNQFIKDLEKVGHSIKRSKSDEKLIQQSASELYKWMQQIVASLWTQNLEKLWQLLYIVDLPEATIKDLPELEENEQLDRLSKLIFLRELQKVELRKRFSRDS